VASAASGRSKRPTVRTVLTAVGLSADVLFIGLIAENWNWNVSKCFHAVFDKAEISREDGNEVRPECHDVIRNREERYRRRP
jgi:hypothetical protein